MLMKNLIHIIKDLRPWDQAASVVLDVMVAFLLLVVALIPVTLTMLKIRGVRLVLGQWVQLEEEVQHS